MNSCLLYDYRIPLALQAWDILQAGHISLHWHRRREETRVLWSCVDWGLYHSNLWVPLRAIPSPANCYPIPILQMILTDIAGIRRQLDSNHSWFLRDHHDEVILGTIPAL